MKKIAIFTEGQSEQIFVRNFLKKIISNEKISFECLKLLSGGDANVPYEHKTPNPDFYFLIINVQNDERVLSIIKERERELFNKGYEEIIGLRDMYSEAYHERSSGRIRDDVTTEFIEGSKKTIKEMSDPKRISIFFSVMELEAWFLSMYNLFKKLNGVLSLSYIEKTFGYKLQNIDPQKKFYRPSSELKKILSVCGMTYKKSADYIEKITNKMELGDFENSFEGGRCQSFRDFFQKIKLITNE